MMQTLIKNRWLLTLCGILEAITSFGYFVMYDTGPNGRLSFHEWHGTVDFLNGLTVAAGVSIVAASMWRSARGKPWLLLLNGLALCTYGLLPLLRRGPLGFDVFALLVVMMAIAFGIFALTLGHAQRASYRWFLTPAAVGSAGFSFAFLALVNGWIPLERRPFHPAIFLWLCVYFAFSALCMMGLALWLNSLDADYRDTLPPLGNPSHATSV